MTLKLSYQTQADEREKEEERDRQGKLCRQTDGNYERKNKQQNLKAYGGSHMRKCRRESKFKQAKQKVKGQNEENRESARENNLW